MKGEKRREVGKRGEKRGRKGEGNGGRKGEKRKGRKGVKDLKSYTYLYTVSTIGMFLIERRV